MWLNIFGVKPEGSRPPASACQTVIALQYPIVYRAWGCKEFPLDIHYPVFHAQPYVMPVHRTTGMPATNTSINIEYRTLLLFFKARSYAQLCFYEAFLTHHIGTSAIWSSGQAVQQKAGLR
jgi:hypothetical protein